MSQGALSTFLNSCCDKVSYLQLNRRICSMQIRKLLATWNPPYLTEAPVPFLMPLHWTVSRYSFIAFFDTKYFQEVVGIAASTHCNSKPEWLSSPLCIMPSKYVRQLRSLKCNVCWMTSIGVKSCKSIFRFFLLRHHAINSDNLWVAVILFIINKTTNFG